MVKDINKKKYNFFNMKNKFSLISILIILMFGSVFAQTQNNLLEYKFEEGGGSVILDTSGNDNHGTITGTTWSELKKFGLYAMEFDGSNDFVQTITGETIPDEISFSFWVNSGTNAEMTVFSIFDTTDLIEFKFDTNSQISFDYIDTSSLLQTVVLDSNTYTTDNYYHIVLNLDNINNQYSFYLDNALLSSGNLSSPINRQSLNDVLIIGTDSIGGNDFDGLVDEFKIFDFIVSESQVSELYSNNVITYIIPVIEPDGTNKTTIINYATPDNETLTKNAVEFNLNLIQSASCEFYLDNNLIYTFNDIVSVNFIESLENGEHKYFYYCSYLDENNILNYEMSKIYDIEVTQPPTEITFQIIGNDFNVNDEELYIQTPCAVEGYSAIGYTVGYQPKYNPRGINWVKVENGLANFNITATTHDFCLFNGRVIINEEGQTINYNVQEKEGFLELGNFTIPSSEYQVYVLNVDLFEIYDKFNPEAYGKDWSSLAGAFIMFLLGGGLTFAGVRTESKVLTLIGGTLLLGAFGLTMSGVLTLINL